MMQGLGFIENSYATLEAHDWKAFEERIQWNKELPPPHRPLHLDFYGFDCTDRDRFENEEAQSWARSDNYIEGSHLFSPVCGQLETDPYRIDVGVCAPEDFLMFITKICKAGHQIEDIVIRTHGWSDRVSFPLGPLTRENLYDLINKGLPMTRDYQMYAKCIRPNAVMELKTCSAEMKANEEDDYSLAEELGRLVLVNGGKMIAYKARYRPVPSAPQVFSGDFVFPAEKEKHWPPILATEAAISTLFSSFFEIANVCQRVEIDIPKSGE